MADRTLTKNDLVNYLVDFLPSGDGSGPGPRSIRAAYTVSEPGWLVFKDQDHRMVARINEQMVAIVERID